MMKIVNCRKGWFDSINFVDDRNMLVGFDYEQQCCETFGYRFFKTVSDAEADLICNHGYSCDDIDKLQDVSDPDLSEAYFAEEQPLAEDGKFKINGSPDCNWLVLYNFHNGYYCHGFVMKRDGKQIFDGSL